MQRKKRHAPAAIGIVEEKARYAEDYRASAFEDKIGATTQDQKTEVDVSKHVVVDVVDDVATLVNDAT